MEKGPVTGAPASLLMATVGDVVSASTQLSCAPPPASNASSTSRSRVDRQLAGRAAGCAASNRDRPEPKGPVPFPGGLPRVTVLGGRAVPDPNVPRGGHYSRRVVNRCAHAVRPAEVAASRVSVMICHRGVACRRRRGLTSAVETPGTNSEAVAAADLDRAAVALERAEKAISDLDAEIRTARALLAKGPHPDNRAC